MTEVLMVSKPVAAPWNDSSKNLVRDLAWSLTRYEPVVLTRVGTVEGPPRGRAEAIYGSGSGGFAPGIADQLRVLRKLIAGRRSDLWHFFFAPNPRSSQAGSFATKLRRVPSIHTVCSAPSAEADLDRVLFTDMVVVLSRHTEARLRAAGILEDRLRRIPPGIAELPVPTPEERRATRRTLNLPVDHPLVVYPGDLEFGGGAELVIAALSSLRAHDIHLAMACRRKTQRASEVERQLRQRVHEDGLDRRVTWIGETRSIHALLGAADAIVLPTDTLYAKMDYPLVLLEAMSMARPIVVAEGTAAAELAERGAATLVAYDPAALAAEVMRLVTDDDAGRRSGTRAREVFLAEFTRERMAAAYESLYDELV